MNRILQSTDFQDSIEMGRRIANALDAVPEHRWNDTQRHDAYQTCVLSAMNHRKTFRPFAFKPAVVFLVATLLAIVGIGVWQFYPDTGEIPFRIGTAGSNAAPGTWVKNTDELPVPIVFENGSRFEIQTNSAARIIAATRESVHIDLSYGALHAEVIGNGHTRWQVTAGPFHVTVLGTVFRVDWDAGAAQFSVSVTRGVVAVADEDGGFRNMKVSAGQQLVAKNGKIQLAHLTAHGSSDGTAEQPPNGDVPEAANAGTTLDGTVTTASPRNANRASSRNHPQSDRLISPVPSSAAPDQSKTGASDTVFPVLSWQSALQQKDWDAALPFLLKADTVHIVAATDENSLWELANWLRHQRHPGISGTLFESYRQRYPGTERAATAAFLLGKSALDQAANPERAVHWLKIYLAESPNGFLREEALGRILSVAESSDKPHDFAPYATEYLTRFPEGPYAPGAERLLKR
jgi:TolA-binding protein